MSSLSLVPVDQLPEILRKKVAVAQDVGGDPSFFQFAGNAPHMAEFYWSSFYEGVFFQGVMPMRIKQLVRLRLASHSGCGFCQAGDAESARQDGVTQEEIDAVLNLETDRFTDAEQCALRFADHVADSTPPTPVSPELLDELQRHYSQEQLVELFMVTAVLNGMGRMLVASGFIPLACPTPAV